MKYIFCLILALVSILRAFAQNKTDSLDHTKLNRFGLTQSNSFNDFTKGTIGNYFTHEHSLCFFYKRKTVSIQIGCSSIFNLEEADYPYKKVVIYGPTGAISFDLFRYKDKLRFPLYLYYTYYKHDYIYGLDAKAHLYATSKGFKFGVDYSFGKKDRVNPYVYIGPNFFRLGYDYKESNGYISSSASGSVVLLIDFGVKFYIK